jgi:hypothetical protein
MSINKDVLIKYVCDNFVETGTCNGETVQLALDCGYKNIYSVEIDPTLYGKCVKRFEGLSNVHLYLGDSFNVLPAILKDIDTKATFWLDAHILDVSTVKGKYACPIIPELNMIVEHSVIHNILVDDRRIFKDNGIAYWENVKEREIAEAILKTNKYKISYEDGYTPKDIIVGTENV